MADSLVFIHFLQLSMAVEFTTKDIDWTNTSIIKLQQAIL